MNEILIKPLSKLIESSLSDTALDRAAGKVQAVMQVRGAILIAVGTALLSACASTSIASTPPPPTSVPTTTTTTTIAPTTTPAPTTTVAPTTTIAPTTTTTTTTTVPVNPLAVPALDPAIVAVGTSDGPETARAQLRLLELGFWVQASDGDYGLTTQQAVMAFQKYYGLVTDGRLGDETAALMSTLTERPHGRSDAGTLVEIDKGKQVLIFVINGRAEWILNTSTGNGQPYLEPDKNSPGEFQQGVSITRNGLHEIYRERPDGWWEGDLGEIYRPKYFSGGQAIHGSNSIPDYPASHGCVRISTVAMDWVWETGILPIDTPVWVHEGIPA